MITDKELYEKVKEIVKGFQGPRMVLTGLKTEADAVWQLHRSPNYANPYVTVRMKSRHAPAEKVFYVDLDKIQE